MRVLLHPARAAASLMAAVAAVLTAGAATECASQEIERWPIHSLERPRPPVVDPGPARPAAPPPSDAIVLFDGRDLSRWRGADGLPHGNTIR